MIAPAKSVVHGNLFVIISDHKSPIIKARMRPVLSKIYSKWRWKERISTWEVHGVPQPCLLGVSLQIKESVRYFQSKSIYQNYKQQDRRLGQMRLWWIALKWHLPLSFWVLSKENPSQSGGNNKGSPLGGQGGSSGCKEAVVKTKTKLFAMLPGVEDGSRDTQTHTGCWKMAKLAPRKK